jgi:hypothetical protein
MQGFNFTKGAQAWFSVSNFQSDGAPNAAPVVEFAKGAIWRLLHVQADNPHVARICKLLAM